MKTQITAILLATLCHNVVAQTDTTNPTTREIDEVVVTGTNNATGRSLLPYTVSTIGKAEIESTGHTQLLTALTGEVPSLFISQRNILGFGLSNGGSGGIKIRGVGGSPTNAVLMMVDGQPQFAGIYSHHVADFYETEYVDHVEVLRGPGSVLYGSNAMGGVINVITKQAQHDGCETIVKSQYGSYNTWQSSATNMFRHGKFSSLVSASYDRTDGLVSNFDFEQISGYAKVGYDFSDQWNARADYSVMKFIGNDPIYAKLSKPESTDIYHQNITRGESSLSVANTYAKTNGVVRVYYSYGNHYIDDPRHFHSLDDRFGVIAYQNIQPCDYANITIGFDFDTYTGSIPMSGGNSVNDNTTPAKMQTFRHKSITEWSPYVTASYGFLDGRLAINGGLRMANSDRFGSHWVPQVGIIGHPTDDWDLRASLAKGYRNPSFKEMYLYKMANEDLDPENMMNYEVAVGRSIANIVNLELTAYIAKGSNMIETVDMKNINTGSFTNKGIELTAKSRPTDKLSLRASYSYLNTDIANLPGAPKNQIFVGASWDVLQQLTVEAGLKGVGGLQVEGRDNQNYALLDLKLTYNSPLKWMSIFANLDNVTDTHYVINRGYDMPGFNFSAGFRLKF